MLVRCLIAYFSHSGNTKRIAKMIGELTKGSLYEICPQNPYPSTYKAVLDQARREIMNGVKPALKGQLPSLDEVAVVFVGTPNWWSTIAPPVASFLSQSDLAGKLVIPFCTHGGSGLARIATDMERLVPGAKVLRGYATYEDGGQDTIAELTSWLALIGGMKQMA